MQFPSRFKEDFIKELGKIKTLMDQTPNQATKMYIFSAVPAFMNRVINFEYNKELLLLERILNLLQIRASEDIKGVVQTRLAMTSPLPSPPQLMAKEPGPETRQVPEYTSPDNARFEIINPKFFEILSGYLEDLKHAVEHDENLMNPVANMVELFYTLTGNGNYLLKKKVITLDLE